MAARDGMTEIITALRLMTDTAESGDTVNGVEYWTDDQLQTELDKVRIQHRYLIIRPIETLVGAGLIEYKIYPFPKSLDNVLVERYATLGAFVVQDRLGTTQVATDDYYVDYDAKEITFVLDTDGTTYYLSCRSYDLNRAAASIWLAKAGLRASLIDWKTDNHTLYEDEEYQHCMQQYKFFSSRGGFRTGRFIRSEERVNYRGY